MLLGSSPSWVAAPAYGANARDSIGCGREHRVCRMLSTGTGALAGCGTPRAALSGCYRRAERAANAAIRARASAVAAAAVPPGSFTAVAQLSGERLATPLKQGSPLMPTSLVGAGLLTGAPPGSVAVSVRPADPAIVQLLNPGQLVDVVLGHPDGLQPSGPPTVLAAGAPILWTAEDGAEAWPGAGDSGAVVVLAAAPGEAAALAAASGAGQVHLILTGG